MTTRRAEKQQILALAAGLATTAAALALLACGSSSQLDPGNAASAPDYSKVVAAAPPRLAALYEPGGTLVGGGLDAYEARIGKLKGFPIVVNKWASWCGPCRIEFPFLQQQAAKHADEIAFVGVDSNDSDAAAETFLRDHPVPYPSFSDPDQKIAREIGAGVQFPATVFYRSDGEIAYVHHGLYSDEAALAADIREYAAGG